MYVCGSDASWIDFLSFSGVVVFVLCPSPSLYDYFLGFCNQSMCLEGFANNTSKIFNSMKSAQEALKL